MKIPNKSFFIIIILVAVILISATHKTLTVKKEGFNIIRNPFTDAKNISSFLSGKNNKSKNAEVLESAQQEPQQAPQPDEDDDDESSDEESDDESVEHETFDTKESVDEFADFKEYQTFKNYEKFKKMMGNENIGTKSNNKKKRKKEGFNNMIKQNIMSKQQLFGF